MRKYIVLLSALFLVCNVIYGDAVSNSIVAKTGQTYVYCNGDDGYYQKGLAWTNTARFTVGTGLSSNCVVDNLTQLMWLKNPDTTQRNWTNAIWYCENLDGTNGRGGYTDWRLPNRRELFSLVDDGADNPCVPTNNPFLNIQANRYWSSTTCEPSSHTAWSIIFINGYMFNVTKASMYYTWPVRGP